eukprot:Nitzschia sp. Nitz4//scaffold134_size62860//35847//36380//NITZ4_006330-RA/size62860-processed-gene-0.90-mRNA-1//-1//CDS//3329535502//395//frame0
MGNTISQAQMLELKSHIKVGKEVVGPSKNAKLVAVDLIEAFNMRNIPKVKKLASEDSLFFFAGADRGMPLPLFMEAVGTIQASFPDIILTYDKIEEIEDGIVKITNLRSRGTHTGVPFAFGPYPAVDTTNIVVEDNCQVFFTVKKGKLVKSVVETEEGELMGPPQYYFKIGGKIPQE